MADSKRNASNSTATSAPVVLSEAVRLTIAALEAELGVDPLETGTNAELPNTSQPEAPACETVLPKQANR